MSYPRKALAGALAACSLTCAQQALAQSDGLLEEVIVTAEKRATTIQDTPLAVTAFSGAELDRALINKPLDMQFSVPNMLMSKGQFNSSNISRQSICPSCRMLVKAASISN